MLNKLSIKYNINLQKAALLLVLIIIVLFIIGISVIFFDVDSSESETDIVINHSGNSITYVEGDVKLDVFDNNELIDTLRKPNDSVTIYEPGSYEVMNQESDEVIEYIVISESDDINSSFDVSNKDSIRATDDILFNASDKSGEIIEYVWDFGDDSDLEITSEDSVTKAYNSAGEYTVLLTVVDEDGKINTEEKVISVGENELSALASVDNDSGFTTTEFEFNASKSLTADNDIESYVWDFDDGNKSEGEVVTHSYDESGVYMVDLEVIDSSGETDTDTIIIHVEGTSIDVEFESNETQKFVTEDFKFNTITANSIGTSIDSKEWDLGDNTTVIDEYDVIHSYDSPGEYMVELTIFGTDGVQNTDSLIINVDEIFIDANINTNRTEGEVNTTFELDGSDSITNGTSVESYEWDLGDNNTATGEVIEHSYNETGEYNVSLTIVGENGDESTDSINLTVNSDINAQISVDETEKEVGEEFEFNGLESSTEVTNIESYNWNFGDETEKTGEIVTKFYTEPEIYVVGLTVIGEDGTKDSDTITVNVTD